MAKVERIYRLELSETEARRVLELLADTTDDPDEMYCTLLTALGV